MKKIENGIVYSNDINLILNGYNNLDYNYNGMMIPNLNFINDLRENFRWSVNKIFSKSTIIAEEEMILSINSSLKDVLGIYPHCITR